MTSEMISGPDLGAGFLHQLSFDAEGDATTFTYHVQDGGSDAGGPPKGSVETFGFVPTPTPCMFGGPRCWHRRFLLPRGETLRVRQAYHRNRFVLSAMVDQAHAGARVPLEAGLKEVLARLAEPLSAEGVDWYIGGSVAAFLLGARIEPADLDLGTTRAGVDRIASLLSDYLIEPVAPTDWPGAGLVRGARAFVGSFAEGLRVEWSVPLDPGSIGTLAEWSGRPSEVRTAPVLFGGHRLRVTRPEYAWVRAAERGRASRRAAIAEVVRRLGPDPELLEVLLERSRLAEPERERLREEMRSGGKPRSAESDPASPSRRPTV